MVAHRHRQDLGQSRRLDVGQHQPAADAADFLERIVKGGLDRQGLALALIEGRSVVRQHRAIEF